MVEAIPIQFNLSGTNSFNDFNNRRFLKSQPPDNFVHSDAFKYYTKPPLYNK